MQDRSALRNRLRNRETLCFRLGSLNHSAKFEDADLTNAILRNCQFSQGMELNSAIVEGCQFGDGVGLSAIEKEHLKRRGGIFNDAPGDRSSVETPSPNRR